MSKKVAVFWPGDYRAKPNEWALPQSRETTEQLVAALRKLGRSPYVVDGYLTRPDEAIAKLGPIDDPMIGVFVHWTYAPHTVDGVVGKDNPLLLASNFSGTWPGLVALLEHRGLARKRRPRRLAGLDRRPRLDRRRPVHGAPRRVVLDRPDRLRHQRAPRRRRGHARGRRDRRRRPRRRSAARRVLALMLGDTSMGMINGYFGPRLLYPIGFSEHKVDQAWLIDRDPVGQRRAGGRRLPVRAGPGRHASTGTRPRPRTSPPTPPASSSAATWPCSTCSTSSRPTAWAGSTSSAC